MAKLQTEFFEMGSLNFINADIENLKIFGQGLKKNRFFGEAKNAFGAKRGLNSKESSGDYS